MCQSMCVYASTRANHVRVPLHSRFHSVQNKEDGPKGFLSIFHKLYLIFPSSPSQPKGLIVPGSRPQKHVIELCETGIGDIFSHTFYVVAILVLKQLNQI